MYVRYMDDMLLLVNDKRTAAFCKDQISASAVNEKLQMNPKSEIIPVKNGVEFLGWRFTYSKTGKVIQKVKQQSKKRMFLKVKCIMHELRSGRRSVSSVRDSMASYKGYLEKGNAYRLYVTLKK
jgi:RNA-directed DNA polymerase